MSDYVSKYKGAEIDGAIEKVRNATVDAGATLAVVSQIPKNVSQLKNDSKYISKAEYDPANYSVSFS